MTNKRSKAASEARQSFYQAYREARCILGMAGIRAAEKYNMGIFSSADLLKHVDTELQRVYDRSPWPVSVAIRDRHSKKALTRVIDLDGGTVARVDAWLERYDSLPENYARLVRSDLYQNLRVLKRGDFRIPG